MIVENETDQQDRGHRNGRFKDGGDESVAVVRVRETQFIDGNHQQHAEKTEKTHDLADQSTAMKKIVDIQWPCRRDLQAIVEILASAQPAANLAHEERDGRSTPSEQCPIDFHRDDQFVLEF